MKDRTYDPQRINLYVYAKNSPLAFVDPTGERIEYADDGSEEAYKKYVAYLEQCGKKCADDLATVVRLKESSITYVIDLKGGKEAADAEGELTTDGQKIYVNIGNVGGAQGEDFSLNSRFAHELEHARQFNDGELSFVKIDGKWKPSPATYDIGDEVKAWEAQLRLSVPKDFTKNNHGVMKPSLLSTFANAKNADEKAGVLARSAYPNRNPGMDHNASYGASSGHKPGDIIRTSTYFGVVNKIFEDRKKKG